MVNRKYMKNSDGKYECHECGMSFASVGDLYYHLRRHRNKVCDLCNRLYCYEYLPKHRKLCVKQGQEKVGPPPLAGAVLGAEGNPSSSQSVQVSNSCRLAQVEGLSGLNDETEMADTGDETSGSTAENPDGNERHMGFDTRPRTRIPHDHHPIPLIIKQEVQEDRLQDPTANDQIFLQTIQEESDSEPSYPNTIPMEDGLMPPPSPAQSCREDQQPAVCSAKVTSANNHPFEPVVFPEMESESTVSDWTRDIMKYALEDDDTFKDVTFLVGPDQEPISAHRLYLGMISPTFGSVFFKHPTFKDEKRHLNLLLPDTLPSSFRLLLRHIYAQPVNVDMDEALEVLKLAYRFKISDLVVKCMSQLQTGLNSTNAAEILQVAWGLPDAQLKECALAKIASNPKAAFQMPEFLALELDPLCDILQSNLNSDEVSIFLEVKRWAEHSLRKKNVTEDVKITGEDIRKELGRALFLIRFPLFTGPEFCQHVSNAEILRIEEAYKVLATIVQGHDRSVSGLPFSSEPRMPAATSSTATVGDAGVRRSENETTSGFSEPIDVGTVDGDQLQRERECSGGSMGSRERGATETATLSRERVHPSASEEEGSHPTHQGDEDGKRPSKRSRLISDETNRSGETESTVDMDVEETPTPSAPIASTDPVPSTSGCVNESNDISRSSINDQEVEVNSRDSDQGEQSQLIENEEASKEEEYLSSSCSPISHNDKESHKKGSNPPKLTKMTLRKSKIQKLLTEDEENYIKDNIDSDSGNNLTNFYNKLKVIENTKQIQVIHPPVVINIELLDPIPINAMNLEFPYLTDFHVNYLINNQTIQSYKTDVIDLNIVHLLPFRNFVRIEDLRELYYMPFRLEGEEEEVNVTITLNGVTILKADFREDSLTLSRVDTSIQWIMKGVQESNELSPRLKSIHLEECSISFNLLPCESLENITMRGVTGLRRFAKFLQKCKNLREFSCNDVRLSTIDFGVHLGFLPERRLTPEGTKLRRIALGNGKIHCSNPRKPLDNKMEELYLDNCLFSSSFVQGFHLIFPNLKKLKIVRNNSVNLILNALKIDSLEWVGIWEPNWRSAMPKNVEGRGKNPHDPAVLEINKIFEDVGFDASWINSSEKGFVLFRQQDKKESQDDQPSTTQLISSQTSSSGSTVEPVQSSSQAAAVADPPEMTRRWSGAKLQLEELSRLDYEHFGWSVFYRDYDLFQKFKQ